MFDNNTITRARQTDLPTYLAHKGERLKREGNGFHLAEHDSLKIKGNMFNWFSQGNSGNAIDFVMVYYGLDFKSAVEELTGEADVVPKTPTITSKEPNIEQLKTVIFPEMADNERRVLSYLSQKRGLYYNNISDMIRHKMIYQDKHGNCVFVITDFKSGEPIGYELRGTGDTKFCHISEHRGFGFNFWCTSELDITDRVQSVLLFESAIDLLSYYQFYHPYQNELLVSMGGINPSVVENCAALYPNAELVVCTDNDEAGNDFAQKTAEMFPYKTRRKLPPEGKDWNDFIRISAERSTK